jgi:hypothetical protein
VLNNFRAFVIVPLLFILSACAAEEQTPGLPTGIPSRSSRIAENAQKMGPSADQFPPLLHSGEWEAPVPLPGPINTAGGEDSPFITPDGKNFFFFFTPNISIPAEKQLTDGVTGIYQSRWVDGAWTDPTRVVLSAGLALDGCPMVVGNQIWFCTAREGLTGLHWFKASYAFGIWGEWEISDFDPDYKVGEMHITADGQELYFHSDRPGTLGENDIWLSQLSDGIWGEPINLTAVNSSADDSRPFISADGQQLWFTRTYLGSPAVYLSNRVDGGWSEPILIVSQFAGEPTLDQDGNLYFVHHFLWDGELVEADIYLAKKK